MSAHAPATILTTFLTGIAPGSCLSAWFVAPRMRRPRRWFCALEILAGIAVLGCIPLLASLANVDAELGPHYRRNGEWHSVLLQFADAFVVLFLPSVLMGAVFPIVTTACLQDHRAVAPCVAQVYGTNAIGCIVGVLLTCFVLLPASGTLYGLLVLMAIHLTLGVVLIATDGREPSGVRVATAVAGRCPVPRSLQSSAMHAVSIYRPGPPHPRRGERDLSSRSHAVSSPGRNSLWAS